MHLLARPLCRARREPGAHSRSQRDLRPRPQRRARTGCRSSSSTPTRRCFAAKHATATADNVIRFYVTDAENATSIVSAIGNARENARALRPLVSTEMWVTLNVFHNRLKAIDAARAGAGQPQPAADRDQGIVSDLYRHHRGHVLSRSGLVLLPARALYRARRPDDPPARHEIPAADRRGRSGRGGRPVARAVAVGLRLSRLPPGAYEPSDGAAGGRISAVQPELSALGLALRARDRPGARRVALAIRGAARRRGRRVHRRAAHDS